MIKEFKSGDGCRFMCTCIPGSTSVFDMDVDDGVEVVEFEGFDDVSIGKVAEKSFPSVKTLVIGEEVECMSIPNEMFPNVRNIISYNRHFLNSDMLIRVDYNMFPDKNGKRTDVWLLNTFCKKPDEVINLKSVEFIDGYAFYGCRSTKIINEDCVKGGFKLAFFGSAFMELEPVGGAYMAGSMIIDVDKDAKELVIPETATYFLHNIHNVTFIRELCKSYDKIIVKNSSLFFQRVLYAYAAPKNRLMQVTLPKSIKKIGKSAFIWPTTPNGVYADIKVQISSIPKDFIFGFVKQGISSDAKTSICVHLKNQTENFKFVLPDAIRLNSDYSRINFALNNFANHPELSKKVLNEGFLMASNAKSVDITAYKTYKLTKGQRAKEFIRDNSDDIAFSFARMMPEKDFVDFVKLDFVKLKYSEKLAEQLRKNEWTTGMAYMLEATVTDDKSERKNFAI